MLLKEILLIYSCSTGIGCTDTVSAYYQESPRLQEAMQNVETKARATFGETATTYFIAPGFAIAAKQNVTLPLTRNWFIETGSGFNQATLRYKYEF
jgi:hypothetical protein